MRAKFLNEKMYSTPEGLSGELEFEFEDLVDVIKGTAGSQLGYKELRNIIDFMIEIDNVQIADQLLNILVNYHPYIVRDALSGNKRFHDEFQRYALAYPHNPSGPSVPPFSMN